MGELTEVFDDLGENVGKSTKKFGKFLKENPFIIAVIAVIIIALIVAWRRKNSVEMTDEAATFYTYPTAGGGGSFQGEATGDSLYYDLLAELQNTAAKYDAQIDELNSNIGYLSDKAATMEQQNQEYQDALLRQQLLNQMQANSDMAILAGSQSPVRDTLHQENMDIAAQLGLTYDGQGTYYDALGNAAYITTLQSYARSGQKSVVATTGSKNVNSSGQVVGATEANLYSDGSRTSSVFYMFDTPTKSTTSTSATKSSSSNSSVKQTASNAMNSLKSTIGGSSSSKTSTTKTTISGGTSTGTKASGTSSGAAKYSTSKTSTTGGSSSSKTSTTKTTISGGTSTGTKASGTSGGAAKSSSSSSSVKQAASNAMNSLKSTIGGSSSSSKSSSSSSSKSSGSSSSKSSGARLVSSSKIKVK